MYWQKVNFSNTIHFCFFPELIHMNQITKQSIHNKNEEEISRNIQYSDVYREMIHQMANNSDEEYS